MAIQLFVILYNFRAQTVMPVETRPGQHSYCMCLANPHVQFISHWFKEHHFLCGKHKRCSEQLRSPRMLSITKYAFATADASYITSSLGPIPPHRLL